MSEDTRMRNNFEAAALSQIKTLESSLAQAREEIARQKKILESQEGMYRDLIATQEDLHHEMVGTAKLTAECDRYREALEKIANDYQGYCGCDEIAREALQGGRK